MYAARFSYNINPIDRDRAIELLAQQVAAARTQRMEARLLIPVTRAAGGAALVFEVVLGSLDELEPFRESGLGTVEETRAWLRQLSEILLEPPVVELFRIAGSESASQGDQS